jgi:hypothetical protein
MNPATFMASLPIAVQIIVWAMGIIGGYALTIRFSAYSAVRSKTDFAREMTQRAPTDKEKKKSFPGTREKIGEMGIIPDEELRRKERENSVLESGLIDTELDTAAMKRHADSVKNDADLLSSFNSRLGGVETDLTQAMARFRELKEAGKLNLPDREQPARGNRDPKKTAEAKKATAPGRPHRTPARTGRKTRREQNPSGKNPGRSA